MQHRRSRAKKPYRWLNHPGSGLVHILIFFVTKCFLEYTPIIILFTQKKRTNLPVHYTKGTKNIKIFRMMTLIILKTFFFLS